MSMISCVICNRRIAFDADPCPKCGTKDPSGRKRKKLFYSRLFGLATIIGAGTYFWFAEWPQLQLQLQHIFLK